MTAAVARVPGAQGALVSVLDARNGGPLVVPHGDLLVVAGYHRQGPDLRLDGPDGETVLVRDFFAVEHPPLLVSAGGARIAPELAVRLAGPVAPGQVAQAAAAPSPEPIGTVETVAGTASLTRADGSRVAAQPGVSVFQGDVVETDAGGSIGMVLADDTTFAMGESARMVLDEMVYDPGTRSGTSAVTVVQGVFTFVSGHIAASAPDAMTVHTPVANIGIRGTSVAGQAAAEGQANTITLLPNSDGSVGEIAVSNAAGVQILSVAHATTRVASFFAQPAPPVVMPVEQVRQMFGAAIQARPPEPARGGRGDASGDRRGGGDDTQASGEARRGQNQDQAGREGRAEGREEAQAGPDGAAAAAGQQVAELAAQSAVAQALAAGATPEQAFAAAQAAASQAALAAGAPPEAVAAATEAARAAFQAALASGLGPDQAMAAAMAAIQGQAGAFGPGAPVGDAAGGNVFGTASLFGPAMVGATSGAAFGGPGGFGFNAAVGGAILSVGGAGVFGFGSFLGGPLSLVPGALEQGFAAEDERRLDEGLPSQLAEVTNFIAGGDGPDFLVAPGIDGNDAIGGRAGNDYIYGDLPTNLTTANNPLNPLTNPTFAPTGGNDAISGGSGDDTIWCGPGNDIVDGDVPADAGVVGLLGFALGDASSPGNDVIDGGAGDDTLYGNSGNDTLMGGTGVDRLDGGEGADVVYGGDGNDIVEGGEAGAANDSLFGNAGASDSAGALAYVDTISYANAASGVTVALGSADGTVDGSATGAAIGTDALYAFDDVIGSSQVDTITGNDAANVLNGGAGGDDTLSGGAGNDTLTGATGNDTLDGGTGNDSLNGGVGDDTYAFSGTFGGDTVLDVLGTDTITGLTVGALDNALRQGTDLVLTFGANTITLTAQYNGTVVETLNSGGTLYGLHPSVTASGLVLAGADASDDSLSGGGGNDFVFGNGGNDTLGGGAGTDALWGGLGDDVFDGGLGDDVLVGGRGADNLTGGAGNDVFAFQGGTGVAASFARIQTLGTDSIIDFTPGADVFRLADADFGFGTSGTLSASANALTYVETATALTGTPADVNGGDSSNGPAILVIGAATGTAGVQVWYVADQAAADTSNSYQIAAVAGANTGNVSEADFKLVA